MNYNVRRSEFEKPRPKNGFQRLSNRLVMC
jgi:hypothetical protein